ncbi:MAG: type II toxin-antitoxin system VapC family toxin [Burkholderiales bacterium]|nr:type II toxin-antitoxin system VapC family toxin [Burkholderiales bacterium]MCA3230492.1 type II toxin-antitoxin system VapC family toxin [Burkholderiales bacterium]
MRYMLDTDICIYAVNERPPRVLQALRDHPAAGLGVSTITASELHYGVARTGSTRNAEALGRFLASPEVADFDAAASDVAGQLRAWLAERGTPVGPYDALIATHAQSLGVTLVTNNLRKFGRVPGLKLANWTD